MKIIYCWILLATFPCYGAEAWTESDEVGKLFAQWEVSGAFVIYDPQLDKFIGYNHRRSKTRFIPASTFKIPHALIGLDVGAVQHVDEVLPYGGALQPVPAWERDMSLRSALPISNFPVFQTLARRITLERMSVHLARMQYGNQEIGLSADRFWLDGPLTISPIEQTLFLAKLARNQLPYSPELQNQVREITLIDSGVDWELYAKTGWTQVPEPAIGWWVGWVVSGSKVYSFALNMDINSEEDAAKRIPLGRDSLVTLGVLTREK